HPFENKPVMIVGASYYDQGTSRAQVHLRMILDAPGVNAYTLPGNEFLLGKAKEAFDVNGNITNEGTVNFLETCLDNFVKYVGVVSKLKKPKPIEPEDLYCTNSIATTIQGVDPDDPEWVEKAAELVGAVSGDTYVKLDHGILTVNQLDMFLKAMPFELTFADDNNQFLYFNNAHQDPDTMFGKRVRAQSGNRLGTVHGTLPDSRMKNVEWVVGVLRNGDQEYVRTIVPGTPEGVINTHNYQAMYYPDGSYAGINEIIFNFQPWLDWYLNTTGQRLVGGNAAAPAGGHGSADATSGASDAGDAGGHGGGADATSGASN
ncbi:MAG: PAS domain-containing protein, partial [Streptococcus mitis]|nr:PAS domain-containing protein [Streptococcus mitis]